MLVVHFISFFLSLGFSLLNFIFDNIMYILKSLSMNLSFHFWSFLNIFLLSPDQIGLSPEEVISKIMANPEVAMAFQNPRVQAAIMDVCSNLTTLLVLHIKTLL